MCFSVLSWITTGTLCFPFSCVCVCFSNLFLSDSFEKKSVNQSLKSVKWICLIYNTPKLNWVSIIFFYVASRYNYAVFSLWAYSVYSKNGLFLHVLMGSDYFPSSWRSNEKIGFLSHFFFWFAGACNLSSKRGYVQFLRFWVLIWVYIDSMVIHSRGLISGAWLRCCVFFLYAVLVDFV